MRQGSGLGTRIAGSPTARTMDGAMAGGAVSGNLEREAVDSSGGGINGDRGRVWRVTWKAGDAGRGGLDGATATGGMGYTRGRKGGVTDPYVYMVVANEGYRTSKVCRSFQYSTFRSYVGGT